MNENEIVLDEEEVIEVNQDNAEEVETSDVKTYTEEEVEQIKADLRKEYDDNSQKLWNNRWAREKEKFEKENAPLFQIEDVLKEQLGATDRNDLMKKVSDFYQVDINNASPKLTERQERILAKADAEDIKSLGMNEMVSEANRIASIPQEQRTVRENIIFGELASEITEQKNRSLLKEKGYDLAILEDNEFKDFRNKLNYRTSIAEAVDMYNAIKGKTVQKPVKPASAGSTKSNITQNQVKDFYTREESLQYSKADFDKNPDLWQAMLNSMSKW
mgnify:CR=1 FL=1